METIKSEAKSLIFKNDIEFTNDEYYLLHNFFITYSLCKSQSHKKRTLKDYGFKNINSIKQELDKIIPIEKGNFDIIETKSLHTEDLVSYRLNDSNIYDVSCERGLYVKIAESNKYFILFHYIRNSLAHGEYIIKNNSFGDKVLIMQNSEGQFIKARLIIKVETLLKIINVIDIKKKLHS